MQKYFLQSLKELCKDFSYKSHLLAVSGGLDSMAMLHLYMDADIKFAVAHCNFKLRDEESDRDEAFIQEFCSNHKITLYTQSFDTPKYAKEQKISIQEAARALRYKYFQDIAKEKEYDYIATAHNRNDVLESFFINISRGSGIKGLASIPERNGNIIRPLLPFSRTDIIQYAEERQIQFVEDSSNAEDKYLRNRIRHHLLPLTEEIMSEFSTHLYKSIMHLREASKAIDKVVEKDLAPCKIKETKYLEELNVGLLLNSPMAEQILLRIFHQYHFPPAIIKNVLHALNSEETKIFYSGELRLIARKDQFIIDKILQEEDAEYLIFEDLNCTHLPISISAEKATITDKDKISKKNDIIHINIDKAKFPLKIRKWKNGDKIIPLGMKGSKKISDYLTDKKLKATEKEQTYIIEIDDTIAAVIGHGISDLFALKEFPNKAIIFTISK